MSVRTIRKAGVIVGYQGFVGNGGPGCSKHFSVAKLGGEESALGVAIRWAKAADRLRQPPEPKARGSNAEGIPGLRLIYMRSKRDDSPPLLYAQATWVARGRNTSSKASTDRHGLLGAVQLVMDKRDKATRKSLGLTARQALNRMRATCGGCDLAKKARGL